LSGFTVIIPTRDSSGWIGVFLKAYRALGVEPLYIVDTRSCDDTLDILRRERAAFVAFSPMQDFAEAGMVEFGAAHAETDWVIRLDDDEFPSRAMLDWAEQKGIVSKGAGWLMPRRELFEHDGAVYYSNRIGRYADPRNPTLISPQARLYHRKRVYYLPRVHTSGLANARSFGFAPPLAFFVHMNCLLRSQKARLEKIYRYERIEPDSCWRFADEYLPELFSLESHGAARDGLDEFETLLPSLPRPGSDLGFQVSEDDRSRAEGGVAAFEATVLRRRREQGALTGVHYTADDFAWIRRMPRFFWQPVAEFCCSFARGRLKAFGVALWNFQDDVKRCPEWEL
jgi:Glycosyl transferase family 2